jgi:pimeloyl-ACP methyl ester carboxylesterase
MQTLLRNTNTYPGIQVDLVTDKPRIQELADLTTQGLRFAYHDKSFRAEMVEWIHHNLSKKKDGMPGYSLRMALIPSFFFPIILRWFDIGWLVGDVVIIPGFFGSWNFLRQVGDHFNHLGFRIWTIPQLGLNLSSLENSVQIVKNFLVTHHITQPIFISHSKGGLIAKSLLYDDSIQTKYCISFSTPYQGTYLGYFYFGHANEFIPNSTALNKLASHSTRNSRIWALYSRLDNFVLPNKYLACFIATSGA